MQEIRGHLYSPVDAFNEREPRITQISKVMNIFEFAFVAILILFGLMALRAFRSGSTTDYLLCGAQFIGLLVMLGDDRQIGAYLLLITALAYLASQLVTGARPISRSLPIAGALVCLLYIAADHI
jgi:hypothetical protein